MQTLLQGASERLIKTCSAIATTTLMFLGSAFSTAQNATETAPHAYKLQFENKWVRVIRVHYEPREKYLHMLIRNNPAKPARAATKVDPMVALRRD